MAFYNYTRFIYYAITNKQKRAILLYFMSVELIGFS